MIIILFRRIIIIFHHFPRTKNARSFPVSPQKVGIRLLQEPGAPDAEAVETVPSEQDKAWGNGGIGTVMAMATSYNWLFLWDYAFYKWGFVSTYK